MSRTVPDRNARPRPALDALLETDTGSLLQRALWLDAANRQWRAALPAHLRGHVRLGNLEGGCLTVLASSPAFAERARLSADMLLQLARENGMAAQRLKVRVARHQAAPLIANEPAPTAATRRAIAEVMALFKQT